MRLLGFLAIGCAVLSQTADVTGSPFSSQPSERSRVVIVSDPQATVAFRPRPEAVRQLMDRGIMRFTGKPGIAEAWRAVAEPGDVVGIKVFTAPGPDAGTRLAVVAAAVEGLIEAGIPPANIIVWDRNLHDLRLAGYFDLVHRYNIRVTSSSAAGWDEEVSYSSPIIGNLVWGDLEFGRTGAEAGRRSFVTRLLTKEITKLINITPMLNHNLAGVTGNLFSLALGGVDNTIRFEPHGDRLAVAVPELYALPELSDRVALNIVDALICQYHGEERARLHYSVPLNQLRFSADPVALDVLSIEELTRQRENAGRTARKPPQDIYTNAALLELGAADAARIRIEWAGGGVNGLQP